MKTEILQANIGKRFRFLFTYSGKTLDRSGTLVRVLEPLQGLTMAEIRTLRLDLRGEGRNYLTKGARAHRAILKHSEGWTGVPERNFRDLQPLEAISIPKHENEHIPIGESRTSASSTGDTGRKGHSVRRKKDGDDTGGKGKPDADAVQARRARRPSKRRAPGRADAPPRRNARPKRLKAKKAAA